jgi:uncharacterized coiled-coil protein SlyX
MIRSIWNTLNGAKLLWTVISLAGTLAIALGGIIYSSVDRRLITLEAEQSRVRGIVSDRGDRLTRLEIITRENAAILQEIYRRLTEHERKIAQ